MLSPEDHPGRVAWSRSVNKRRRRGSLCRLRRRTLWRDYSTRRRIQRMQYAPELREAAEPADGGIAGRHPLAAIVEHPVPVVGAKDQRLRWRPAAVLGEQRFQDGDHVDVSFEMRGFVEAARILLPLGRAQMNEMDARAEPFGHPRKIVVGPDPKASR